MGELLPCPFCGQPAGEIVDATRILGKWRLIHRCKVLGPVSLDDFERDSLVDRWNTRDGAQEGER